MRVVGAMLLAGLAAGCTADRGLRTPSVEEATELECRAEAQGSFGRIAAIVLVSMEDGSRSWHYVGWQAPEQRQPAALSSAVYGPVEGRFSDETLASVAVTTLARIDGPARMEVRGPGAPPIVLGSFGRGHSMLLGGGRRRYTSHISWGALRAALAGGDMVEVALVGEDGRDLSRGWIAAATLAAADEALAALRPRIEAALADPRRHCAPPPLIIVARPPDIGHVPDIEQAGFLRPLGAAPEGRG